MYVVLHDINFFTWILEIGQGAKKASPVNTATISVICLQVLPNNKPYVEAKDAYYLTDVQANRTHVIT